MALSNSLGARLAEGRTTGFDYMRLGLSVWIIYWHSRAMVGVPWTDRSLLVLNMSKVALPMFFALSGFLVASSLERLNHLPTFLAMRVLRILPALAVEVIMSALILGPLLTVLSLQQYFAGIEFWRYFWNIVGYIHYELPGVFQSNPNTQVNASLWTVPYELECYIGLSILFLIGIYRRTWFLIAVCLICSALLAWREGPRFSWDIGPIPPGRLLPVYFIAGAVILKLRHWLPGGMITAVATGAVSVAMLQFDFATWFSPLALAYATAALGCTSPPRAPVILGGDYSYGMYLYAFPIQQTWEQLLRSPSLAVNFIVSVATIAPFAAFSWHCIEKPVLSLKSKIMRKALPVVDHAQGKVPITPDVSTV